MINGWIDVKDRLPSEPCLVLVWVGNDFGLGVDQYLPEIKSWANFGDEVLAWQYAPGGPE
jgi:hypothetical protein